MPTRSELGKHFAPGINFHIILLSFEMEFHPLSGYQNKIVYLILIHKFDEMFSSPWRRGLVVSSPPTTEETGAMDREIESRQGIAWEHLCPGGVAQRTSHLPQEREDPGLNPARA
jgi:hypothetical protein